MGLLWALCLAYLWRLFSPIPALRLHVVQGDFTNQFYPFRYFAAMEWRAGRVPLWNPYVFAGHPFLADIQTAVFYPLSLADALLSAAVGPRMTALELEMAAHYPLAALFAYLLGRQLLGSRFGALVAAVAFTFSGFLTSYPAQQLAMLEAAVWLPLIFLLLELAATRPSAGYRWHVAAGLALGVCVLAGHPQTAMFVAYTSLAYLVYRTVSLGRTRAAARAAVVGAVVFLAVGLGLAAVELLPAVEFVRLSTRATLSYEAAAYGYERRAILGVLLPAWRGEKALYVGVLPVLLAAIAVARAARPAWWRDTGTAVGPAGRAAGRLSDRAMRPGADRPFPTGFLAVVAVVALLLSFGDKTPLFRPVYLLVPGFTLFRDQERIIYLYAFALSVLAGAGASYLAALGASAAARARGLWLGLGGALALFALYAGGVLYLGWSNPAAYDPRGQLTGGVALFAALAAASAAALYLRRRTDRARLFGGVVLGVVVVDLFVANLGNNLSAANPDPGPRFAGIVAALNPTPGDFRVRGDNDEVFPPNYGAVWGLPTINGDTPFGLQRVADFLYADNAEWRRWQVLNVKYFFTKRPAFEGVEPLITSGDLNVHRVVYSLPRAWAVRDAQVASGPADALARVLAPPFHPGDTVVLEEPPAIGPFVKGERPDVRIVSYSSQRVEIAARGDGDAVVVLADTYYPGWRAYLDGAPTTLHRANYVARAVELPPGEHSIEMVFEPVTFRIGAAISALALVGSLARLARRPKRAGAH